MRSDVGVHRPERSHDGLMRATAALLGVERGPEVAQQPVCRPGGLQVIELGLTFSKALLRLGSGLPRAFARLVHESHLLLLTAREQTTQRALFVVAHAHVLGESIGQSSMVTD